MRRAMAQSALVFASVLMIVALAGCGGGGKTAVPLPMPVTAPEDSPLAPGATSIPAGESRTVGEADGVRTVATCPADGPACVFTVAQDGSATFTGGEPMFATYTTITGLPEGHSLASGTIPAGESRTVRDADGMRTVVTCPADGDACMVSVGDDGAAEATGGAPTVATISYTTITGLPEGHSLASGTIPAGQSRTVRDADGMRTVVTCPADGDACMVSVGDDGRAEATGGVPTVVTISYTTITGLPEGALEPGTFSLSPGESRVLQETAGMRTLLTCPSGGEDCVVTVGDDGAATATGGAPTVATYTPIDLPGGHTLASGTTIPPGESLTVWSDGNVGTLVTCPADGEACVFRVEDGAAEYTGGTPAVATEITGLSGHTLTVGTTIPAGGSRSATYSRGRGSDVACPAGGEDCFVAWVSDSAAEFTGGAPTLAAVSNEMVWQANNGPDGTSDGAHARGLQGALLSGSSLDSMFRNVIAGWTGRAGGSIVQSTAHPEPAVTATASWAGGAAPTLGLTLGATSFSLDGDSSIPSLGEGWNGVALENDLATLTRRAVLYSNIEEAVGGTPDGYYLTLGAWVIFPDDPAASSTQYNMGAFANGHSATALNRNAVLGLTGTATYQGPATGLYTAATYTGSGGSRALESATVGSFTATATINANFGTGGGAVIGMGGSVTDFEENGESLGNWTVSLNTTAQVQSGALETFYGRTGGSADGRALSGNWGVQFYRDGTSGHPHSAVGVFTSSTAAANNDALHMVGAYGAERN